MVTVVEGGVQGGAHGIKGKGFDIIGGQLFGVGGGQALDAPEVIIDQADLHAGCGTLLQDLQNGIPHQPLFKDEVFKEDEFFGTGQLLLQRPEKILTEGEVFHRGTAVDRIAGDPAHIVGLHTEAGMLGQQRRRIAGLLLIQGGELPAVRRHPFPVVAGQRLIAEFKVENAAQNRQGHDKDDPGDFIGGVIILGDKPDNNGKAQQHKGKVQVVGKSADIEQDHGENAKLHDDQQREPEGPADQKTQDLFHLCTAFVGEFQYYFTTSAKGCQTPDLGVAKRPKGEYNGGEKRRTVPCGANGQGSRDSGRCAILSS